MRIITGTAKGLKLKSPANFLTRPTSDRIKESLFSILSGMKDFSEVGAVLDIFAGTGALGLESLSRGAKSATFIDETTTDLISENVRHAKFESICKIFRGDFLKILKKISRQGLKFDLIFSDPPYSKGLSQASINLIAELGLLKPEGFLILEHGRTEIINVPKNLNLIRKIDYGKTTSIEIIEKPKGVLQ